MAPAATRDFDAERQPKPEEGPQFKLGGEWFHCSPTMPYPVMQAMAEAMVVAQTDAGLGGARAVVEVGHLFDSVLVEADIGRFHVLLSDKDRCPNTEELQEISNWVISAYSGRPTQPPSDLPAGPESGSTTSTDDSSSLDAQPAPTG